ncbi:MAG: hypothetical protein ACKV2T_29290, partial [Kofleriaceae bacterium]
AVLDRASGYQDVRAQIGSGKQRSLSELQDELQQVASAPTTSRQQLLRDVHELVQSAKAGYEAKRHGIAKLSGGAHRQCAALLETLARLGIFVVRHGELEGWRREGPSDKNEWIVETWEMVRRGDAALPEARAFAESVIRYVRRPTS